MSDELRNKLVEIVNREGGEPGNSLHSWRCEDSERYPAPCTCVAEVVDDLLPIIEAHYKAKLTDAYRLGETCGFESGQGLPEGWTEREEWRHSVPYSYDQSPQPERKFAELYMPRDAVIESRRVRVGPWEEVR